MRTEATLQAPNSLLLVTTGDPPDLPISIDPEALTTQTSTCIAVAEDDEVTVVLSDEEVDDEQLSLVCETAMDGHRGLHSRRDSAGRDGAETVGATGRYAVADLGVESDRT